ncbi:hypothetical protein Gotur_010021 [Gossypium turneri]
MAREMVYSLLNLDGLWIVSRGMVILGYASHFILPCCVMFCCNMKDLLQCLFNMKIRTQLFYYLLRLGYLMLPVVACLINGSRNVIRLSESLYTVKGAEEHAACVDELNRLAGSTASESSCLVVGFHEAKKLDMIGKPNVRYSGRVLNRSMDSVLSGHTIYIDSDISWIIRKYGSHSYRREYLKPLANVWFYFVRYSFMAISHSSTISMEQILLLYAIMTKGLSNVGKIILKEIHDCARKKTVKPNEPTESEIDESSNKSKTEANSVTETKEVKSEEELNETKSIKELKTSEPRDEPNANEPVEPSIGPELTILIPTS